MNGKCLDIGIIQAFLDGETRPDEAIRISDHVAECDPCTLLLAQAEEENSLVFSVLDREMNTLVPTQRLWTRINAEIADEKSHTSVWQRFLGIVTASLASPSFAGAAGILIIAGMMAAIWTFRTGESPQTAGNNPPIERPIQINDAAPMAPSSDATSDVVAVNSPKESQNSPPVGRTNYSVAELKRIIPAVDREVGPKKVPVIPASAQYLPGEESYIRTIDELQEGVTAQSASLKASSQVAFHRDLAVVDDAIEKMRKVVRKNPRNQAARQILYSSYQDKIDLLKSSAQRSELMASVQ
jgi:hypothetical protein